MKFFLDTGNIKDIETLVPLGIVDGVTTNPSLMAKELKPLVKAFRQTTVGPPADHAF